MVVLFRKLPVLDATSVVKTKMMMFGGTNHSVPKKMECWDNTNRLIIFVNECVASDTCFL